MIAPDAVSALPVGEFLCALARWRPKHGLMSHLLQQTGNSKRDRPGAHDTNSHVMPFDVLDFYLVDAGLVTSKASSSSVRLRPCAASAGADLWQAAGSCRDRLPKSVHQPVRPAKQRGRKDQVQDFFVAKAAVLQPRKVLTVDRGPTLRELDGELQDRR